MGNVAQLAPAVAPRPGTRPDSEGLRVWQALVLLGISAWLYVPILGRLTQQWWTDPNFSHGFFVPLFSLFVLWQDRSRLSAVRRQPSLWGLPVIIISLCTLILGVLGAEVFLARTSLILLAAGITVFLLGWKMLRAA